MWRSSGREIETLPPSRFNSLPSNITSSPPLLGETHRHTPVGNGRKSAPAFSSYIHHSSFSALQHLDECSVSVQSSSKRRPSQQRDQASPYDHRSSHNGTQYAMPRRELVAVRETVVIPLDEDSVSRSLEGTLSMLATSSFDNAARNSILDTMLAWAKIIHSTHFSQGRSRSIRIRRIRNENTLV